MKVNIVGSWIDGLQQAGYYSFLRKEVARRSALSPEAVKKSLQRLAKRKRIAKVTNAFYVIVPIEYRNAGAPPGSWFIDHFMTSKKQPYYVGLLSAAALYGASHHQPQEFQVITDKAIRLLHVGRQRIRFFTKRMIGQTPTSQAKTPAGMMQISTPEATALDLVRFSKASGYLSHVATVVKDLVEKLDPGRLVEAADGCGELPTVQRLGYLLDRINARSLADPLANWLRRQPARVVPLRCDRPLTDASRNERWKLLVNEDVEVES